ncbi:GntR family transcriptional regulator [Aureimonas frigidaquae]|uniref:GntR family transcriptional regulator n=1 Tax=Aureimonas frigidaquae TaxID=424757 RepID=UPI000780826B|nr:GntR family transcriptional regulator [Aureimonas frigidaquae]
MERNGGDSLAQGVYDAIREALRNGEYKAGDRLREEEVAKRLNVSRTPVREAFRRLQTRRLIESSAGRGLIVRSLEVGDVMELYAMREIIEGAAARLAAEHASETEIENMRDLNEALQECYDDTPEMARLNRHIHETIYRAARNRYLNFALEELQDAIGLLGSTTFSVRERPEQAALEHAAIIDAIAARKADEAEKLARAHIRGALRARLRILQRTGGDGAPRPASLPSAGSR